MKDNVMITTIIFTQAYNARGTIRRTIESILRQTHGDFEYHILDNGSTDDTEGIITEYVKIDERVKLIRVNTNDITNGGAFFTTIVNLTSAKYFVWCDADDEYTPDFLENMIAFSEENQLDIAACGYEKIDVNTNEVIKHRALKESLVIYDRLFSDEFINYRGFTTYLWGKLYSVPFLKAKKLVRTESWNRICNDSIWMLKVFEKAERAGIYGKAMYKYYQYPHSLSHRNIEDSMSSYIDLWMKTKKYIEHYGAVSKVNEDFLHAIHLSLVEEAAEKVFSSELSTGTKLELLSRLFGHPIWRETMTCDADLRFRNLAERGEFVDGIKNSIFALPGVADYGAMVEDVVRCVNAN